MSMPGFEFGFHCRECDTPSERTWPLYVFPTLYGSTLCLPTWSRELRCYGDLMLDLPFEQRAPLERDFESLKEIASRLSTPLMTVGVPRMLRSAHEGRMDIEVVPEPCCARCGGRVDLLWSDEFARLRGRHPPEPRE